MSEMHGETDESFEPDSDASDPRLGGMTGHARIDASLERLHELDDLEITAHPEEFDAIHGVLREALAQAGRDEIEPDPA